MKMKKFQSSIELIDFWSIPHFLFGSVMALFTSAFTLPTGIMFFTTLFLAIIWELFEYRNHIVESFRNRVTDVIYPLIAFPVTYFYAQNVAIDLYRRQSLLVIVSIIFFYINYMAWKARFADDNDFKN
jgi:hypothetical protein